MASKYTDGGLVFADETSNRDYKKRKMLIHKCNEGYLYIIRLVANSLHTKKQFTWRHLKLKNRKVKLGSDCVSK